MAAEDVLTQLTVVTATRRRKGGSVPYLLREQTLIGTLVGEATELKMKRPLHSVSLRISCSDGLGIRFSRAGGQEFGSPLI
ncbi:unnamed protein product [Gadus morhua 'NCC']